LGLRLVALLGGALVATGLYLLVRGLTPATVSVPVLQTGLALLVPLGVAAVTPLRRLVLPIGLGSVAATAAMVASPALDLGLVVVPAVVAAVSARVLTRLGRTLRDAGDDRAVAAAPAHAPSRALPGATEGAARPLTEDVLPADATAAVPAGAHAGGAGRGSA
jgi:hypothetical protein